MPDDAGVVSALRYTFFPSAPDEKTGIFFNRLCTIPEISSIFAFSKKDYEILLWIIYRLSAFHVM